MEAARRFICNISIVRETHYGQLTVLKVSTVTSTDNIDPRLCLDNAGGVIVGWWQEVYDDTTNTTTYAQVFAQKINSAGIAQWGPGGVQVCTAAGLRGQPDIVSDGAGGAIIAFMDTRNNVFTPGAEFDEYLNLDIYAQRISNAGNLLWNNAGADVCTATNAQYLEPYQTNNYAISDGAGGAIVVFDDYPLGVDYPGNLYAQKLNSAGIKQWASSGIAVCVASGEQYLSNIISDGAQGLVALWTDMRSTPNSRLYAQQINASGTNTWVADGILISGITDNANGGYITGNAGNYIVSWRGQDTVSASKISAQKINSMGALQWAAAGADVYTNPNNYSIGEPRVVISDSGKVIITWEETTNNNLGPDIYARKLNVNGATPRVAPTISSFFPLSGIPASKVYINGNNLNSTTSVSFGGTEASSFTILMDTAYYIEAVVGAGSSGNITVTKSGVTAVSPNVFTVITPYNDSVSLCPNSGAGIVSNLSGNSYQWQMFTDTGFINLSNVGAFSGVNTRTLQLSNIPAGFAGLQFRCRVNGNTFSRITTIKFLITWTGSLNNDWENAANWGCGSQVPDASTNVVINGGSVIIHSSTTVKSINLKPGANLSVAPGAILNIKEL